MICELIIDTRDLGPKTKIMRKAKMSFQSGQVKQVIRAYSVEIQTDSKKDLDAEAVTLKLRKAMGANCMSRLLGLSGRKTNSSALDDRQTTNY